MSGESMKKTHNLVAVVGKYKDSATGAEKNRYMNIGSAFTREDGSMAIKLESIPVGPGWNGWVNLYLPRDKQQAESQTQARTDDTFKDDSPSDIPVGQVPFGD